MANIAQLPTQVNDPTTELVPIDRVIAWVETQASKADMGGSSARLRATSLRQMAEQVAPDEASDARSILENLDRLADRWARRHEGAKGSTARTYASRARTSIEEYFRYLAAPSKYDPRKREVRAKSDEKPKTKVEAKALQLPLMQSPPPPAANAPSNDLRICPLGAGREPFRYTPPADGLQMKDAFRIGFHLLTICEDYDASAMTPQQAFAMALQRSQ